MSSDSPPWDSVERLEVTERHFVIVIPTGGVFEVGIADGIRPWRVVATCTSRNVANSICTKLAMHYRIGARHVA